MQITPYSAIVTSVDLLNILDTPQVQTVVSLIVKRRLGLVVKGSSRLPVTEEIAGSNPVGPAIKNTSDSSGVFFIDETCLRLNRRSQRTKRAGDRRVVIQVTHRSLLRA